MARVRIGPLLVRSLRLRCPRCGDGRLFARPFRMQDGCAGCRLTFHPEEGYYVGAMYVNFFLITTPTLTAGLLLQGRVALAPLLWTLCLAAVALGVAGFHWGRSLWLAADWWLTGK